MNQLTIESVQQDFKVWRASKPKKSKIPNYLWDKTLKLLEHYPISRVVRDLGLSGSQVSAKRKQNLAESTKTVPVKHPANFVEVNLPSWNKTPISENRLEIKRSDGMVLAIEQVTAPTLLEILNQFMRGI